MHKRTLICGFRKAPYVSKLFINIFSKYKMKIIRKEILVILTLRSNIVCKDDNQNILDK